MALTVFEKIDTGLKRVKIDRAQIGRAQFQTRKEDLKIKQFQQQLPGEINKTKKQLEKISGYKVQVKQRTKEEAGQKKKFAKQVLGREAQIRRAALNLAKQGAEQHSKIAQYRREIYLTMVGQINLNQFIFEDLRQRWWRSTIWGIRLFRDTRTEIKPMDTMDLLHAASRAWRRAIDWHDERPCLNRKKFIKNPVVRRCPSVTEGEMFPKLAKLSDGYAKQFDKLNDAELDLRGKVAAQKARLQKARGDLALKSAKANDQINAALKKRAEQLANLDSEKDRFSKHLATQKRQGVQAGQSADQIQKRKAYLAGRAAQVAKREKYLKGLNKDMQQKARQWYGVLMRYIAAKRAAKKGKQPKKPSFPGWFKELIAKHKPGLSKHF